MKYSVIIFTLTLCIVLAAVFFRGPLALSGIAWGLDSAYCDMTNTCSLKKADMTVNFGAYDPSNSWKDLNPTFSLDHIYVQFGTDYKDTILKQIGVSEGRGRWLMVTVEPYPISTIGTKDTVLSDITNSSYDQTITDICSSFVNSKTPVFIRFAHEMERVTGRYPWAINDSSVYKDAYNHFAGVCKNTYDKGFYVWSPAGEKNLQDYFPGYTNVDYIGLSVYALPSFDQDYYGHFRSFSENFGEKYERVKGYERPVMIAEIGVSGSKELQRKWIREMTENTKQFPLLKTIVYFNAKDNEGAWESKYGIPDWRIDTSIIETK